MIFRRHVERTVWGVSAEEAEKRVRTVGLDERQRLGEENIGAIALERNGTAIDEVRVVKIIVAPPIRGLAQTAATMNDALLEAAVLRPVGIGITQMPFAENPRAVASLGQRVCERPLISSEKRSPTDRVPDTGRVAVVPGQEPCASRGAGCSRMELLKTDRVSVKAIEVRCSDERVAVSADRRIALIVRQYKDDIWPVRSHQPSLVRTLSLVSVLLNLNRRWRLY